MVKKIIIFCLFIGALNSCEKKDPCDVLIDGVYQFPELPENHTMTSQEVTEFWDLPEDICGCIATEGLIETCLNYPDLRLIFAGLNPQNGYDLLVKDRFRGMRELESRSDRSTGLLMKYKTINPIGYDPSWDLVKIGKFLLEVMNFEVILSQYINLEPLTKDETIELIETALTIYDLKLEDIENYSLIGLNFSVALIGRLMYANNYIKMVDLYNQNYLVFELLNFYGPSNLETVELIYNLSFEYLNQLN